MGPSLGAWGADQGPSGTVRRAATSTFALGLALALPTCSTPEPESLEVAAPAEASRTEVDASARFLVTQVPFGDGAQPLEGRARGLDDGERLPPGSRIVLFDPRQAALDPPSLTPGFHAAGRADLSDDAKRFVFVGQRAPGERFQVWEASLAGGEPRQVTRRAQDCLDVLYLSTLFTIDAAEPQARLCFRSLAEDGSSALYTCLLDGGDEQRITYQPYGATLPLLLQDGRLLFACSDPSARSAQGRRRALRAVNVDGTDVQAFAFAQEHAKLLSRACETPDGHVLFAETLPGEPPAPSEAAARTVLVSVSVTRSLRSRRELEAPVPGCVRALAALPDGSLVACFKPFGAPEASFELCRLDSARRAPPSPLLATPRWDEWEAVPVQPRAPRPGRSSVVDAHLDDGFLYCLDAGLTDLGPELERRLDAARTVEILSVDERAVDASAEASPSALERRLGSAPVEHDGSFFLKVPARRPLRLRLLDEGGGLLVDSSSWFWVMPKEARGCIGCHEDPELTPPNRFTRALRAPPNVIGAAQ